MHAKLAFAALVAASLFGATAIASAQTQPAADAATSTAMASMHHHHHYHRHHHHHYMHMGYSRGGMASSRPGGRPISRKPAD